jgi:hypothetical protein
LVTAYDTDIFGKELFREIEDCQMQSERDWI